MPSINQVMIMGHLGADPDVRYMQSGEPVANLRVATSSKGKDGTEYTEWHSIVAFRAMAEQAKTCKKGDLVTVYGKLRTRKWQDQSGNDRYTTEVQASILVKSGWTKGEGQTAPPQSRGADSFPEYDDEIPFS